jgi:hypothetical protein
MHVSILRHNHAVFTDYDLVLMIVSLLNFYVSHVILDYIFACFQYFDMLDLFCTLYFADI